MILCGFAWIELAFLDYYIHSNVYYVSVLMLNSALIWHYIFQGGWEKDESREVAASREAYEEAGVLGNVQVSDTLPWCILFFDKEATGLPDVLWDFEAANSVSLCHAIAGNSW